MALTFSSEKCLLLKVQISKGGGATKGGHPLVHYTESMMNSKTKFKKLFTGMSLPALFVDFALPLGFLLFGLVTLGSCVTPATNIRFCKIKIW